MPGARSRRATAFAPAVGGLAAAFSFYPGKNLGAFGDAGALVTDDADLAARVRALREHGQRAKYIHELEGYTARLDTIQAIVLLAQAPASRRLERPAPRGGDAVLRRPRRSRRSRSAGGAGRQRAGLAPLRRADGRPAGSPRALARARDRNGRHYPEPPHLSPAYAGLGYEPGAFPVDGGARIASASRCRSSRGSRRLRSTQLSPPSRPISKWLTHRQTTRRTG